jgi:hypothetical protein
MAHVASTALMQNFLGKICKDVVLGYVIVAYPKVHLGRMFDL